MKKNNYPPRNFSLILNTFFFFLARTVLKLISSIHAFRSGMTESEGAAAADAKLTCLVAPAWLADWGDVLLGCSSFCDASLWIYIRYKM